MNKSDYPSKPAAEYTDDEVRETSDFKELREKMPSAVVDALVINLARQVIQKRWITNNPPPNHCGPGWELFCKLSGCVAIEFDQKPEDLGNTWMVRATKDAKIKNISFDPQVYLRDAREDEEPFRDLTLEERALVAYNAPAIRVNSYASLTPSEVIEHRAPNGKFFTVDDMIAVVQRQELQTRGDTEWFGGIDCHHVFYEGFHLQEDGTWQIYWGS